MQLSPQDPIRGVKFALAVWASTSLHGIFIDYCTYNESIAVAIHFAISSGIGAAANGYMLARFSVSASAKQA